MWNRVGVGGCVAALGVTGCASVPPQENPSLVRPADPCFENPILVQPGTPTPDGYREVYEHVLDALDDYFTIKPASRYDGQIETLPRIAPGYEQPWKPGSPDAHERWLATLQTIRHYAIVQIRAGERGGYRVFVEVHKELEDLAQPSAARGGSAVFRDNPTVDRQVDLVGTPAASKTWIPVGRDPAMEQAILNKIQRSFCK